MMKDFNVHEKAIESLKAIELKLQRYNSSFYPKQQNLLLYCVRKTVIVIWKYLEALLQNRCS